MGIHQFFHKMNGELADLVPLSLHIIDQRCEKSNNTAINGVDFSQEDPKRVQDMDCQLGFIKEYFTVLGDFLVLIKC